MDISKDFDGYYVISLSKRKDRREQVTKECEKLGIEFEFFDAVDGELEEFEWHSPREITGWTKGAAALVHTTIKLLEHAKEEGHETILIMEDDLMFTSDAKEYLEGVKLPDRTSWDMFFFGYIENMRSFPLNRRMVRLRNAHCCHCYAINARVFDDYLWYLRKLDQPIDWITADVFQPMGRCLATRTSIAHQKPDYSNIRLTNVHNKVTV